MNSLPRKSSDSYANLMLCAVLTSEAPNRVPSKANQLGFEEPSQRAQATQVEQPRKLDGTLNDGLGQSATPITNFL